MKVLVTGGAGFIGSNFIRFYLKKHNHDTIINLDKLTYAGNLKNLTDISKNPRYRFVKGDIADAPLVSALMKKVDAIIHFAAETHVDRSIKSSDAFIRTNLVGTNVLLKSALDNKIKRFLHISTDEVYGSIKKGFFTERSLLKPSSPYSSSKAGSDLLALSYYKTYELPVIITRSSNNFGPYQFPEKVLPVFITNARMNMPLPVYATGKNIRDWLYVEDNCRAIDCVFQKGKNGEIYNIGGNVFLRNIDLAKRILCILKKPFSLIEFVKDRPGHDYRYAIDTEKIEKELQWKAKSNFDDKLKYTIDWYIKNQNWWKNKRKKY